MLMNKILRYSFMALLAMMVGNVMAGDVTFVPSDFPAASTEDFSATKDGVTVSVTASTTTNEQIRVYKNQTITISSTVGNITKAVFTCTAEGTAKYGPGCFEDATAGSYAYDGNTGTWTGDAAEFALTAKTNQVRITNLVVTVGGTAPSVQAPKFSVPGGTYYEPQTVALTCDTEGAKILYTIPAGQDPEYIDDENVTGVWYDGNPIQITRTTTIKAMAVKDGKTSSIVSATYTIEELQTMTLAQAQAADKGTAVIVEGVVVASAANGAVLSDGTDYLYYYNNENPLTIGQKVRMSGELGEYGGAKQLTSTATITELGTETVTHPTAVTLAAADFESIVTAKVAERKYVTFEGTLNINGNYFNIAIDGTEAAIGSIVKPKEDISALNEKKVVVTGYLMYVNKKYVYVVATSVEDATSAGINNVTAADIQNGVRYNLAGQKVNNGFKGVVIMNGKKMLQK